MTVLLSLEKKKQMTLARAHNRDTIPLRFKGLGRDSQLKQGRVDYCFKVHGLKQSFVLSDIKANG